MNTFSDYLNYVNGVSRSVRNNGLLLRGPAGLFKSIEQHPFCWGLLNKCNLNITYCPINIITFHRKGFGSANDVVDNTIQLLNDIKREFPNLKHLSYANR